MTRWIFIFLLVGMVSCSDTETDLKNLEENKEPVIELNDVVTLFSDSAVVRVKIMADKQLEYENGDQEFPEGIYIESYEPNGDLASSIKADKGNYDKKEDRYTATGNVIVKNLKEDQTLKTEVLHWEPRKEQIHTDKFVEIETEGDILMGQGLTANQDFSDWQILKPGGSSFTIEENP